MNNYPAFGLRERQLSCKCGRQTVILRPPKTVHVHYAVIIHFN